MNLNAHERDIQAAIVQAFRLRHRIVLIPIDAGAAGMRSNLSKVHAHSNIPEGFPDLLGIIPGSGRCLLIEVKRPGAKPRANQIAFLKWGADQGAVSFWADSVDSALAQYEEQTRSAA